MDDRLRRLRVSSYLNDVRGRPCLVCGLPGEVHHVTYAQPRALGKKTSDHYTVPLCHGCHMKLHNAAMPERTWWAMRGIDPVVWCGSNWDNWRRMHGDTK